MNIKKTLIGIIVIVVLATTAICFVLGSGILNPLQHQLNLGYKFLDEGNYTEALIAFDKAITIDNKNIEAYIGKAQVEICLDDKTKALEAVEKLITIISENGQYYSSNNYEQVIKWWINNADVENKNFEDNLQAVKDNNQQIVSSYSWSEPIYEEEEPFREYQVLYINGEPTEQIKYTGKTKPRNVSLNEEEAKKKLENWLGDLGTWVAGDENVLVCDGLYTCSGKEYYQFRLRGWVYDHATTLTWYVISKDGTDMFEGQCNNGKLDRW